MDLPEDLAGRAAKELNETPETRVKGLKTLQQYYEDHPDERPHRSDEPYLLMFLRHAKFDVERAKGRIAALERWLRDCRDEIGDVSALRGEAFSELYGMNFMSVLDDERRTRDGATINIIRFRNMQPLSDPGVILRFNLWMLYRAVDNPYVQVCGKVFVESLKDFSLLHYVRFQQLPSAITRKNFKFMQECVPFRLRGIWVVNQPKWLGVLYAAFVKPFLSAKLRARLRFFGTDLAALHQLVDPTHLPAEFGGTHPDAGVAWFEQQLAAEAAEAASKPAAT